MRRLWFVLLLAAAVIATTAQSCDNTQTASQKEAGQVNTAQQRYVTAVPPPDFQFPLERYIIRKLYEARNDAVATYSYVRSPFTGKVLFWCKSYGFPIPYSTQMTNPQAMAFPDHSDSAVISQPEPNGVFPPSSSLGTWVLCVNDDGTISPSYQEPNVEAYLWPMKEVQEGPNFVLVPAGQPSLKIAKPTK